MSMKKIQTRGNGTQNTGVISEALKAIVIKT